MKQSRAFLFLTITPWEARAIRLSSSLPQTTGTKKYKSKQKWGGITRDPYKTFQKRKDNERLYQHTKVPLKSEERSLREMDYPLNVQSIGQVISNYVPLEKFAKAPIYSRNGLSQRWAAFKENLQVIYSGAIIKRRLKKFDAFKPIEFARAAQQKFINANIAIQNNDKISLKSIATENACESLREEFRSKIYLWEFIEELERPRVVNARVAPLGDRDNLYGQVTVRINSKQIMSVSTLSGRLLLGHKTAPKNVIDYVVFERSLTNHQSQWKLCGKVPPQQPYKNKST